MHKPLNTIRLAGIGIALLLSPAMVLAQDEAAPEANTPAAAMTPEQEAAMQALPAEKQAALKSWPPETQAYYWSLSPDRQNIFWALADSDKVRLSQMPEPQRESTWAQIESRAKPPQG